MQHGYAHLPSAENPPAQRRPRVPPCMAIEWMRAKHSTGPPTLVRPHCRRLPVAHGVVGSSDLVLSHCHVIDRSTALALKCLIRSRRALAMDHYKYACEMSACLSRRPIPAPSPLLCTGIHHRKCPLSANSSPSLHCSVAKH